MGCHARKQTNKILELLMQITRSNNVRQSMYHIRPVLEADFEIFYKREVNFIKEQLCSFMCSAAV